MNTGYCSTHAILFYVNALPIKSICQDKTVRVANILPSSLALVHGLWECLEIV
jgi:hypothetical protein